MPPPDATCWPSCPPSSAPPYGSTTVGSNGLPGSSSLFSLSSPASSRRVAGLTEPMQAQAAPSRAFPWRGFLIAGFAYLVMAIAYTWPLALHLNSGILNETDAPDAYEQTWVLAWVQHALATNPTQLLNAPIFSPTQGVLGYQDHMTPLAVLLYPVQWLTGNPLVVYNVALILAFPLTALAMMPLARYLCGDGRAAFLAGIIVA